MRNIKHVPVWMTDAFLIWLRYIGYRIVSRGLTIEFLPKHKCKNLPRGGCIQHNGQMNKVANTLFAEFKEHVEA